MQRYSTTRVVGLGALVVALSAGAAGAQEGIGSDRQEYFDFLALSGLAERPTLVYSSLSDNRWDLDEGDHPWAAFMDIDPTRSLVAGNVDARLYGPELFSSYNTAYPHGMNDGSLFQGVGLNTSLSAGFRAEAYGVELTLKPTIAWEQNRDYDILPGAYGSEYSYFWNIGIDTPQRFGDDPNFRFDWGDSEVRWGIGTFTIGIGTQAVWLGPARLNPIIMSNNAAPFPKLDVGLRKTATPIGNVEARAYWGYLHESEYFDSDASNDANLITGLTLAWEPSFLPGLTVGANRTMLSRWNDYDLTGILALIWPFMTKDIGTDQRDQRFSVVFDYLFPEVGFDCYFEWGRNDFSPDINYILRYPFHTQAYTLGLRKALRLGEGLRGQLAAEITNLESSRDYEFLGPTTFYSHGSIRQGYTNQGQILGAGIGTGGNSQYLEFSLLYSRGSSTLYVQRLNRDNDYVYFLHVGQPVGDKRMDEYKFNTELTIGAEAKYWLSRSFLGSLGVDYCRNVNALYDPVGIENSVRDNFRFSFGMTCSY